MNGRGGGSRALKWTVQMRAGAGGDSTAGLRIMARVDERNDGRHEAPAIYASGGSHTVRSGSARCAGHRGEAIAQWNGARNSNAAAWAHAESGLCVDASGCGAVLAARRTFLRRRGDDGVARQRRCVG